MPNNEKTYDKTWDPEDHVKFFQAATQMTPGPESIKGYKNLRSLLSVLHAAKEVETGRMKGVPECMRISEFMHGVNNPELTKRLNEHVPKTMEEIMIATISFIRGKAAAADKKKGQTSWRAKEQSKWHASERSYGDAKVGKLKELGVHTEFALWKINDPVSWARQLRMQILYYAILGSKLQQILLGDG
ncbi:hypothetical protein Tco_1327793 [Tanacetum coccineum]